MGIRVEPLEARQCLTVVAPTGVSASILYRQGADGATDKAVIRWTDSNTTETGYRVEYWNDVARTWTAIPGGDVPSDSTSASHVLDAGQQLYYRVRAIEGTTLSDGSASVLPVTPKSRVVRLSATRTADGYTNLTWPGDSNAMAYRVYSKSRTSRDWTLLTPTPLPAYTQNYLDPVPDGGAMEYRVERDTANFYGTASGTAYGYAYAGGSVNVGDSRGRALLVVDQTLAPLITGSLSRFRKDLLADGWSVTQMTAPRDTGDAFAAATLKADIQRYAAAAPGGIQSIVLIGHVPVPYSGTVDWDGHPDHNGAWPADAYYGESIGIARTNSGWTDTGYTPNTSSPQNSNLPGDGKFDQNALPYDQNVPVGRIDFWNLPTAGLSLSPVPIGAQATEAALLTRYFAKNHAWRTGDVDVTTQALIDDHLGGGAPESAWRNFSPLVGPDKIYSRDWDSTAHGPDSYLWGFGAGPSGDYGVGGVTSLTTLESPTTKSNVVFTGFFGSYLGDWNRSGNMMRQMLAAPGLTLTTAWIGAPGWNLHTMGLGETIGQATMLSVNNTVDGPYAPAMVGMHGPQIALMGDPTLTMFVAKPVGNLKATSQLGRNVLSWSPAPGSVAGYFVYRGTSSQGPFVRLTTNPLAPSTLGYTDTSLINPAGQYTYMVRAVTLQTTPSGTYYNVSPGVRVTSVVANTTNPLPVPTGMNPSSGGTPTSTSSRSISLSDSARDEQRARLSILSSAAADSIV